MSARAQMLPGVTDGCEVKVGQQLTKGSVNPHDLLRLTDPNTTLRYIVSQVQGVYVSQGVDINDKHIEVIARQMLRKVAVMDAGESDFLPGRQVNRFEFEDAANALIAEGKEPPVGQPLLLGITKASLATDSFLSAASFQETTKVLTDAAIEGKIDHLAGLKENVIIGKPIPAGTGLSRYREVGLTYKGRRLRRWWARRCPTSRRRLCAISRSCCPSRRIGRSTATATSTWARTTVATTAGFRWAIAARSCPTRTRACTSTTIWACRSAGPTSSPRRASRR
ncbi:MAG: hypothetical protein ACLR67_01130 [Eggerthella lenta]